MTAQAVTAMALLALVLAVGSALVVAGGIAQQLAGMFAAVLP